MLKLKLITAAVIATIGCGEPPPETPPDTQIDSALHPRARSGVPEAPAVEPPPLSRPCSVVADYVEDLAAAVGGFADTVEDAREQMMVADGAAADTVFWSFRHSHRMLANNLSRAFGLDGYEGIDLSRWLFDCSGAKREVETLLAEHGFVLVEGEGGYYVRPNDSYTAQVLSDVLSDAMRDFLEIVGWEQRQPWQFDFALRISLDELRERIMLWDDFFQRYPTSELRLDGEGYYKAYLRAYLNGLGDFYPFGAPSNDSTLTDFVKEHYEDFLIRHGDTETGQLISEYFRLLESNDFRRSQETTEFLRSHDLLWTN